MISMNRPQQYTAKLSDKIVFNQKYTQFSFELVEPNRLEFEGGQYITIALPNADGLRRPYSICSSPEKDHGFELLVDVVPNGKGVQYLNSLQFGDEIQFLAPLGVFVIPPQIVNKNPLTFVATGAGIAPFQSMILDQLQHNKNTQPMILYWGVRHVEELFWENDFAELSQSFPNFHFHPVISQATPEWPLCRGRVTDCLSLHELLPNSDYFLCGSDTMVTDVMSLLTAKDIAKEKIHREKFY